jgi:hypothetical protein
MFVLISGAATCGRCAWPVGRATRGRLSLLTESEVQRSFRNLFKSKEFGEETYEKAEALLEELRAESPLRHRLTMELEEIRKIQTAKS